MEDFDLFTDEIEFTKPVYKNLLNNYVKNIPHTPSGPNYESGRKLLAEEYLVEEREKDCAFYLSESASPSLRTLAVYRDEQMHNAENKFNKITNYVKPIEQLINTTSISKEDEELLSCLSDGVDNVTDIFADLDIDEELPFYKQYMKFSDKNNVDNFNKILQELPKEWTIIQLTAPYNPNENLKPFEEYRTEINSIFLTLLTNEYLDDYGPITINIPANSIKDGEKPLFTELYSLLEDNYKTIDNAQFLNNKRLVQNYWNKRADIDLRIKSVINVMYKDWLGGWSALLAGKPMDPAQKAAVRKLVDDTISDWGFIKLTQKQKILLYNLIGNCAVLNSQQIKSCVRKILTEHGNISDVKSVLKTNNCGSCSMEFRFLNELCIKCLSKSFEAIHHFTLVDGIKAFSEVVNKVKDDDEWQELRNAKRHPLILIVDEMLDTFPWESLPIIINHPVTRIENIHILYALYKIHEKQIVDGYFCAETDVGRYIINPEKNLERMELRMSSFVKYWCPDWEGYIGQAPPPEEFLGYIAESDIFLYCGHGDGLQLARGASAGRGRARCCAVLAGCGSVRLARAPGRRPPAAAHHHLHLAAGPCVAGMLWEVTDLEVDRVVSALLALALPSAAPRPWPALDKARWSQGILDTKVEQPCEFVPERDLLRAVCLARASTAFTAISASVVLRGLPARIAPRPDPGAYTTAGDGNTNATQTSHSSVPM